MKTVCDQDACTGCMACVDSCPKKAISIRDSLNAYNAVIDDLLCVNCDLCHKVCQVCSPESVCLKPPVEWDQGWANDPEIRKNSSSGGAAAAISKAFILRGGCVCSCTFEKGEFKFILLEKVEDLYRFTGSKYIKSNPSGSYKAVKEKLKQGKKVLFIGLPCQVAAVKNVCGIKNSSLLYTVDLICHGSPSPKILNIFLNEHKINFDKITSVNFREKSNYRVSTSEGAVLPNGVGDEYTEAFLSSLDYTENCYHCRYADIKRVSDISLGDSWGKDCPESEKENGVSLILCQTQKGKELLASSDLTLLKVDIEEAVLSNHQLSHPSVSPKERQCFFSSLSKHASLKKAVARCYPCFYYKQRLKHFLIKLKMLNM